MSCRDFCKGTNRKFQNGLNAATSTERLEALRTVLGQGKEQRPGTKLGPSGQSPLPLAYWTVVKHISPKQQIITYSNVKVPFFVPYH